MGALNFFVKPHCVMENRSAFLWCSRFWTTVVTVTGFLGTYLLLPSRLADPRLPISRAVANSASTVYSAPPQFKGKMVQQVELASQKRAIALTFDDGPVPKTTLQVLDILKKNNVKATFFWVGRNLKNYPDVGRKVVADGHAIGNHTWHHWYFRMNPATAAAEVENTSALIYRITGIKTYLFRPPGGFLNNGVATYARSKNYAIMMWSVDPGENHIRRTPSMLAANVLNTTKPGGIVLLHDVHPRTVQALPQIITGLKKRGFEFVTVPELLAMQAPKTPKSNQLTGTESNTKSLTPTELDTGSPTQTKPNTELQTPTESNTKLQTPIESDINSQTPTESDTNSQAPTEFDGKPSTQTGAVN